MAHSEASDRPAHEPASPVLVVPGIGGSGPDHWQTIWQRRQPGWQRVSQRDWYHPVCAEWVAALDQAVRRCAAPPLLVAHSLGCLTVAHWAAGATLTIRAALLVAVPDPASSHFPVQAQGFHPVPMSRLAFRSLVVGSTNDPFGSAAYGRRCAEAWGSEFVEVGAVGHINADSALGEWPEGLSLLRRVSQL